MATARTAAGWGRVVGAACLTVASCLLGVGAQALAAPPTVAQMLNVKPRQDGVSHTTPAAADQKDCKVEPVLGKGGAKIGWVLKDGAGNVLRRFVDTNGDNRIDEWSYYKDGVEVYREVDTTHSGKPDQYRWLNAGGTKWGVDSDKDGLIDAWKVISPEEVSQEVLRALATRDVRRLQALLITDAEMQALGLPAKEVAGIKELRKGVPARFKETTGKLTKLTEKAEWRSLELGVPHVLPAERYGTRGDVVKHARGSILFEVDGGSDWVQTGPLIQVGAAWRLVDAPTAGASIPNSKVLSAGGSKRVDDPEEIDPKVQALVKQLEALDKKAPPATGVGPNPAVVRHHLARADILEKIIAAIEPAKREPWIRQVGDSLSTAAQASPAKDSTAMRRLLSLEQQLVQAMPGSTLTAYVVFRGLQADYSLKLSGKGVDFNKVQAEWVSKLAQFVQTYPKGEDAPDALLQLGMVNEFLSKEVEAKNWYNRLKKDYPSAPQAKKGGGAVRRLELEGKVMTVSGPVLNDLGRTYDLEALAGKVVMVYYWASWNGQCAADFAKLKKVLADNKGVALLCVNLDGKPEEARKFLSDNPAPGTHLYGAGGLEGKLATDYGIMVLPNLFLVGKDGKVLSRSVQVGNVEEEIKKQKK
jgi:thiol-disulfide isomerase/thioredoxin